MRSPSKGFGRSRFVRSILLLSLGLSSLVTSSCGSLPVDKGKVQAESVPEIEPFAGTYEGPLRLQTNDGDKDIPREERIVASLFLNEQKLGLKANVDLAGKGCKSAVGPLKSLKKFEDGKSLTLQGYFEFDRGLCEASVEANQLLFIAKKSATLNEAATLDLFIIKEYVKSGRRRSSSLPLNIRAHLVRTGRAH